MAKAADKKVCFAITPIGDDKSEIPDNCPDINIEEIPPLYIGMPIVK